MLLNSTLSRVRLTEKSTLGWVSAVVKPNPASAPAHEGPHSLKLRALRPYKDLVLGCSPQFGSYTLKSIWGGDSGFSVSRNSGAARGHQNSIPPASYTMFAKSGRRMAVEVFASWIPWSGKDIENGARPGHMSWSVCSWES